MYEYYREKFHVYHFWEPKGCYCFYAEIYFFVIKETNWGSGVWFLVAMHSDFILCPTLTVERCGLETKLVQTLPTSAHDKTKDIIHYS